MADKRIGLYILDMSKGGSIGNSKDGRAFIKPVHSKFLAERQTTVFALLNLPASQQDASYTTEANLANAINEAHSQIVATGNKTARFIAFAEADEEVGGEQPAIQTINARIRNKFGVVSKVSNKIQGIQIHQNF